MVAEVASLKQLLESKLPAQKAQAFRASDLRLLAKKGFYEEWQLLTATRDDLQGPPGDAVKPALIRVLLTAFNPSALQQGRTTSAKHTASVSIAASLHPSHQSPFSAVLSAARQTATPEVFHKASRRGNCRSSCESMANGCAPLAGLLRTSQGQVLVSGLRLLFLQLKVG